MLSLVELRAAAAAPSNPPPPRGYLLDVLYNEPSIQVVTDGFILNEDDTKIIFGGLYRNGALDMPRQPLRRRTRMVNGLNPQTVLLRHSERKAVAMWELIYETHKLDRNRNTVLSQVVGRFMYDMATAFDNAFNGPFRRNVNAVTSFEL